MDWFEAPVVRATLGGMLGGFWLAAWLALGVNGGTAAMFVIGAAVGMAGIALVLFDTRRQAVVDVRTKLRDEHALQLVDAWLGQRRELILAGLGALRARQPLDVELAGEIDELARELGEDSRGSRGRPVR
jgi:hypothetical protein